MTSYVLNYASGETHEIHCDSDAEAIRVATDILGGDVFPNDSWDANGVNDDDEAMERLLIWESEEDSVNDAGERSIAYIERVAQ